jgi:hypothetical protein
MPRILKEAKDGQTSAQMLEASLITRVVSEPALRPAPCFHCAFGRSAIM